MGVENEINNPISNDDENALFENNLKENTNNLNINSEIPNINSSQNENNKIDSSYDCNDQNLKRSREHLKRITRSTQNNYNQNLNFDDGNNANSNT